MHLSSCVLSIVLPSAAFSLFICVVGAYGRQTAAYNSCLQAAEPNFQAKIHNPHIGLETPFVVFLPSCFQTTRVCAILLRQHSLWCSGHARCTVYDAFHVA